MKKASFSLFICVIFAFASQAQKKAVTENGDEVILYDNGTWKYINTPEAQDLIKVNPVIFSKNKASTFLLKSKKSGLGFWVDPKKWNIGKGVNNSDAEFEMHLKGQSVDGYILTEETEIALESLRDIALMNGRKSAPDLEIIHQEFRTVNNLKVLYLNMVGTTSGLKFTLDGYYFSNANSIVQFVVTSLPASGKKYATEINELLNGLVEINSTALDSLEIKKSKELRNDSLPQGSLSLNNNCKLNFAGKWVTNFNGQKIEVERTLSKSVEYYENRKYYFSYDIEWINDCEYKLIFKKTNKPNFTFTKPGEFLNIEILEIDSKTMKYNAVFRGNSNIGEMVKIK